MRESPFKDEYLENGWFDLAPFLTLPRHYVNYILTKNYQNP